MPTLTTADKLHDKPLLMRELKTAKQVNLSKTITNASTKATIKGNFIRGALGACLSAVC